jgi:hypothetical protein
VEKRKRHLSEGAGMEGKAQRGEGVGGVKQPAIVDEAAALCSHLCVGSGN